LLAGAWPAEPGLWLLLVAAVAAYLYGTRLVPGWPPSRRTFFVAGIVALAVALATPIATYDGVLFSVHMVQHLLLIFGAAPLVALGAPLALALRASTPARRARLSRLLHVPAVSVIAHPLTAWVAFALVMWVSHFSSLFNSALENETVHALEHGLYFSVSLLFWLPVVGLEPSRWRLSHPLRLLYLVVALPQQSFLGLAIYSSDKVLYPHYATSSSSWAPEALADQHIAGIIMWVGGDMLFVAALALAVGAWMRYDRREAARIDRRLERPAG
jgi:cytochrome c oxidase assembly factor CtaG